MQNEQNLQLNTVYVAFFFTHKLSELPDYVKLMFALFRWT